MDASAGYLKDGNKNRLRDRDIHKIVDVFNRQADVTKYSRLVPLEEIARNEYNLNIPRYIDSRQTEDIQDIAGHLRGDIPDRDIAGLEAYWQVCPDLKTALFRSVRAGYSELCRTPAEVKPTILAHPEFTEFMAGMAGLFGDWREQSARTLRELMPGCHPKQIIGELAEGLLRHYTGKPLVDEYHVYQHLMDYWTAIMQDDVYLIAADGWKAETSRILERDKNGREKDRGWTCDLVPKAARCGPLLRRTAGHFGRAACWNWKARRRNWRNWRRNTAATRARLRNWTR